MTNADLRQMVREVLREVVPQKAGALAAVETVRIGNEQELQAFVARLLEPATLERVKAGKLKFTLGAAAPLASSAALLSGVISEKIVDRHAGAGTLALAADAVLTPLARDRARKLGLKIERRR